MMQSARKIVSWVAVCAVVSSMSLIGCTKHPNEKQLQTLEETKQAALAAEAQLEQKRQEKATLESQLAQKKAQLEKAQAEKAKIAQKLGM